MAKKLTAPLAAVLLFVSVLLALSFVFGGKTAEQRGESALAYSLLASEEVEIVTAEGSEYALIFSSDSRQSDATLAKSFADAVRAGTQKVMRPMSDAAQKEKALEILIGDTNRGASAELSSAIKTKGSPDEVLVWAYSYSNGKLCYTANCDLAFALGEADFMSLLDSDGTLTVASDLFVVKTKPRLEYEEEQAKIEEEKKQEYIKELIEMNKAFTDEQFNTDKYTPGVFYKPMVGDGGYNKNPVSGEPWLYPTAGQHPRYLINEWDIETLKEILLKGKTDPEYIALANSFWSYADADETVHKWGIMPEVTGKSGQIYRYNTEILTVIDAKAMAYLLTGEEVYALEALICIKNAMLTLHYTTDIHMDVYHGSSHVMVILAAVYDWCYDYLSENDKWQLIWGTAQILGPQMEAGMRYPPSGMNGVSGHGTGPQLARDWMSVASVFYDEAPDWWSFVAGRYFNEYLNVANTQFQNGWVSQGTAGYSAIKIHVQIWANYIIKLATGQNFLIDDARLTAYFTISHITSKQTSLPYQQYYFQTGDGGRNPNGTQVAFAEYLAIAALYNDPVVLAQAKLITNGYSRYDKGSIFTMTPAMMACFVSAVDYDGEGARDGVETIQYFAYPAASMTAREAWDDPDSAAVLMRMMNLSMANHEGQDHGTFQIYYKGLLAGNSGEYKKYGSAAHYYYNQATVASNGLLIYNPESADSVPVYSCSTDHEHSVTACAISNTSRYYYSGSQRRLGEAGTYENWMSGKYVMSETTGAAYGYNKDGSSKYAYLAGDLTKAYEENTVDYVGRNMFTLFTGDEDFPVIFLTFDKIISDNENYTKHWLLHTVKEPEVDEKNFTATVTNGEGKMYVESLFGAKAMVKIGGAGKAWWVNGDVSRDLTDTATGKNVLDGFATDDSADIIWGRIELRTVGEKCSQLLTAMAVTDASCDAEFEIDKFTNAEGTVFGAQFEKSVIVFSSDTQNPDTKVYGEFSFKTEGKGLHEYYIAGVDAGTWQIFVDGISVAWAGNDTESSLLTFTAPAGEVTVKPTSDVLGVGGGKINYVTGGGVLPSGTVHTYKSEAGQPLPETLTRGDDVFMGWYTSNTFSAESKVTDVPKGTVGTFTVYARWVSNFLNEDYQNTDISVNNGNQTVGGVTYAATGKVDASFTTKTDKKGVKYLELIKGKNDPFINQNSTSKNFSGITSDDKCVSFTIKLSMESGKSFISGDFRLIAKQDVNGGAISSTNTNLFRMNTSGKIVSSSGAEIAALSADKVSTLRFVLDFKNGEIRYYGEDGNIIITDKFTAPSTTGAKDTEEFMSCLTQYLWYWWCGGGDADAAMRIYGIRVQEGDEHAGR